MSSYKVNNKTTSQKQPSQQNQKILLERPVLPQVAKDASVTGAVAILVIAEGQTIPSTSYVVSRPIGKTPYDPKKTWVINKSSDISGLKAESKNPRLDRIERDRNDFKMETLVRQGILTEAEGEYIFTERVPGFQGTHYGERFKRATLEHNSAREDAKKAHDLKHEKKQPKLRPKFRWDKTPYSFLNEKEMKMVSIIDETLVKCKFHEEVEKKFPDLWETKIDREKSQVRCEVATDWFDYKPTSLARELGHTIESCLQGNITDPSDELKSVRRQRDSLEKEVADLKKQLEFGLANDEVRRLRDGCAKAMEENENLISELNELQEFIDSLPQKEEEEAAE